MEGRGQDDEDDVRDEREVCDARLVADEVPPRREGFLEHAEHAQGLILVPLDHARELLAREEDEPPGLAKIRAGKKKTIEGVSGVAVLVPVSTGRRAQGGKGTGEK